MARALFGIAVRRAFWDYARAIALVMFVLLMVAWTIDLAKVMPELIRTAEARGAALGAIALPYLGYRTVDIVTRLLPMACFFGGFLAEIRRRLVLETVILSAAGASGLRLMLGALWLGLLLGALQTALEARWRPAAIWSQVAFGVGDYARRFGPGWLEEPAWFISETTAIRGEVRRGDPPALRNLLIFEGLRGEALERVLSAEAAAPGQGPRRWVLSGVTLWQDGSARAHAGPMELKLDLIPQMLSYHHVLEFNLPTADLMAFGALETSERQAAVATALWRRLTAWSLPLALIVMGHALGAAGFDGRRLVIPRLIGLAALGYVLVVSIKVFWKLGEHGTVAAPLAAGAGVCLSLLGAFWVARHR